MTFKNTKTILFASLIIAMILPFSGMNFAEAKKADTGTYEKEIRSLFADIDKDIKSYVNGDMKNPTAKKAELKSKYADNLDKIVSKISKKINHQFSEEDREGLKDLMIREHISEVYRQKIVSEIPKDVITETIEVGTLSTLGYFELPTAHVSHISNPYPITSWKQVIVDRTGGSGTDSSGNSYDIDGGNDLTTLQTSYTSTKVTYTLTFTDEDAPDPDWDDFWDSWRQIRYQRTTDIETFTIDSNGISFSGIWNNDKTFAEFWGQHGNKVREYSGSPIYVSNVWNHSMDITNTNFDMSMTTWTT